MKLDLNPEQAAMVETLQESSPEAPKLLEEIFEMSDPAVYGAYVGLAIAGYIDSNNQGDWLTGHGKSMSKVQ